MPTPLPLFAPPPGPVLDFYAAQSPFTDPGAHGRQYAALPRDLLGLVGVVQGLLLHPAAARLYGQPPEPEERGWGFPTVAETLDRLLALDDSPLAVPRPPVRRLRANCRNFAVLLVSLLRHHGVPARRRVGFARYLPGRHAYIHEIAEYWDRARRRWVLVDPQNDSVTRAAQHAYFDSINQPERARFDTFDLSASGRPDDQFLFGGQAWRLCLDGLVDPDDFRASRCRGLREIGSAVLQDLDGLNKTERRSNDSGFPPVPLSHGAGGNGAPVGAQGGLTPEEAALVERGAELSLGGDRRFAEIRALAATVETVRRGEPEPEPGA